MKKQFAIFRIVLILLSIVFSGCEDLQDIIDSDKSKFYGKWIGTNNSSIIFYSNGSYYQERFWHSPPVKPMWFNYSGTWELKDNRLYLYRDGLTYTYRYSFSDKGGYLTLGYPGSNEYFGSLRKFR